MNKLRINRLDLTCRGIEPATAQAALDHLGPALLHRLRTTGSNVLDHDGRPAAGPLQISGGIAPAALASAIAARVASAIEGHNRSDKSAGTP